MEEKDPVALVAAFAVGAIVGVGATLLLRQNDDLPERIARQVRRSRRSLGRAARRAGGAGEKAAHVGKEALDRFKGEVAEVVAAAREQLAEDVYAQLRHERGRAAHRRRR